MNSKCKMMYILYQTVGALNEYTIEIFYKQSATN